MARFKLWATAAALVTAETDTCCKLNPNLKKRPETRGWLLNSPVVVNLADYVRIVAIISRIHSSSNRAPTAAESATAAAATAFSSSAAKQQQQLGVTI